MCEIFLFFNNFIKSLFILFYYDCYYYVLSYFNFNLKKKKLWGAFDFVDCMVLVLLFVCVSVHVY